MILSVKEFTYENIIYVESKEGDKMGAITIYIGDSIEQISQVPTDRVLVIADFIRNRMNDLKAPSAPTPPPAPVPAPTSVADELLKFSELLEKGVISQEEFDAQKAKLLGS